MTFDREYFESDNQNIGYVGYGYRDFGVHFSTVNTILQRKPSSVLDLGGARGYVAKKLICAGVPTTVMDKSLHCYHTRVVEDFVVHDIEDTPYPFADKQFDLVVSVSVLEHVHKDKIEDVIREISRVGKRSLHGVSMNDGWITRGVFESEGTHFTFETQDWWEEKFKNNTIDHPWEISSDFSPPDWAIMAIIPTDHYASAAMAKTVASGEGFDLLVDPGDKLKINFGSFCDMFYHGWINVDNQNLSELVSFAGYYGYLFLHADMTEPIAFGDNTVDLIFSSHALEHITYSDGKEFMKEVYRILKPGGVVRIAVPDSEMILEKYAQGVSALDFLKHFSPGAENNPCAAGKVCEVLVSGHTSLYDECTMRNLMSKAGFVEIERSDAFHSMDMTMEKETSVSYPTISLVMEARK